MSDGNQKQRTFLKSRASYGSGSVPRWQWQHRVRMRWKGWQRWTTLGSPNFSVGGLDQRRERKVRCQLDGCELPSMTTSAFCWEHRGTDDAKSAPAAEAAPMHNE